MAMLTVFCTALDNVSHRLVIYEVMIQVESLVTSLQDTITAPPVTKLAILDSNYKQSVHEHLQVNLRITSFSLITLKHFHPLGHH